MTQAAIQLTIHLKQLSADSYLSYTPSLAERACILNGERGKSQCQTLENKWIKHVEIQLAILLSPNICRQGRVRTIPHTLLDGRSVLMKSADSTDITSKMYDKLKGYICDLLTIDKLACFCFSLSCASFRASWASTTRSCFGITIYSEQNKIIQRSPGETSPSTLSTLHSVKIYTNQRLLSVPFYVMNIFYLPPPPIQKRGLLLCSQRYDLLADNYSTQLFHKHPSRDCLNMPVCSGMKGPHPCAENGRDKEEINCVSCTTENPAG